MKGWGCLNVTSAAISFSRSFRLREEAQWMFGKSLGTKQSLVFPLFRRSSSPLPDDVIIEGWKSRPSQHPGRTRPSTLLLFDLPMTSSLPAFLFDIPRNPAVAIGLPLVLGFLSGSGTKKVINGTWYQVRASPWNTTPTHARN